MPSNYFARSVKAYIDLEKAIKDHSEATRIALLLDPMPVGGVGGGFVALPVEAFRTIKLMAELFILGRFIRQSIDDPKKRKEFKLYAENVSEEKPSYPIRKKILNQILNDVSRKIRGDVLKKAMSYEPQLAEVEEFTVAIVPQGVFNILKMAATAYITISELGLPPISVS